MSDDRLPKIIARRDDGLLDLWCEEDADWLIGEVRRLRGRLARRGLLARLLNRLARLLNRHDQP
jgi:hypothetical protein